MIGSPLPIAISEWRWELNELEELELVHSIRGRPELAYIAFDADLPKFTALQAGKYLVIWQSETLREDISVAVGSPASASLTRHENQWKMLSVDQIMSATFAYSSSWSISSHTKQTREYHPFEHVSHSVLVDLEEDEEFVLGVETDAVDRQWLLIAWRLNTANEAYRPNSNALTIGTSFTASAGVTCVVLTNSNDLVQRYRVNTTSVSNGRVRFVDVPLAGYAYHIKMRVMVDSTDPSPAGGSLVLRIWNNTTQLASLTASIPTDETVVEWDYPIAVGVFNGSQNLYMDFDSIDTGERFELEVVRDVD